MKLNTPPQNLLATAALEEVQVGTAIKKPCNVVFLTFLSLRTSLWYGDVVDGVGGAYTAVVLFCVQKSIIGCKVRESRGIEFHQNEKCKKTF